jgi:hypothetical protein
MLILDFSLGEVADENTLIRGSLCDVLFIKLRPAPSLISVLSLNFPPFNLLILGFSLGGVTG